MPACSAYKYKYIYLFTCMYDRIIHSYTQMVQYMQRIHVCLI